jgi:dihydrofolate synthase/folylpolyglutamate synthase
MTESTVFESQSLNDWLFYLENQHHTEIELGLGRISQVAGAAGLNSFPNSKVVLVAGTNGKGTTIRFIEQYLLALGKTVGVFSSPHIHRYTERVRLNDRELSEQEHVEAFSYVEQRKEGISLSYFEASALGAFYLFNKHKPEFLLIEVGLGGRLDATNIVAHDLAIITSIGLDHIDWLGSDLEGIAYEKAGIFRESKPAIIGELSDYAAFKKQAKEHKVSIVDKAGLDYRFENDTDGTWHYQSASLTINFLPNTRFPKQNIATGITALNRLDIEISEQVLKGTISNLSLPGRLQVINETPLQVIDVAHNAHSIKHLLQTIKEQPLFQGKKETSIVMAMMKDKDVKEVLNLLKDKIDNWYLGELPSNPRAASATSIKEGLISMGEKNIHVSESIAEAWKVACKNQSKDGLLLGLGSFYTVAEILTLTENRGSE